MNIRYLHLMVMIFVCNTAFATQPIFGNAEKVQLIDEQVTLKAKLDTGANMSSLCAQNIKIVKKDHQQWVYFSICGKGHRFVKPLTKFVSIRSRSEEHFVPIKRPVISVKVRIGSQTQTIPVNLTDRSQFYYPMLLGKDAVIKFKAMVDPSRQSR